MGSFGGRRSVFPGRPAPRGTSACDIYHINAYVLLLYVYTCMYVCINIIITFILLIIILLIIILMIMIIIIIVVVVVYNYMHISNTYIVFSSSGRNVRLRGSDSRGFICATYMFINCLRVFCIFQTHEALWLSLPRGERGRPLEAGEIFQGN